MRIHNIKHNSRIIVGDYQFADKVKEQVYSCLKICNAIPQDRTNVKATIHTEWDWEPNNITFRNLKSFIMEEIEKYCEPGKVVDGVKFRLSLHNFWANVYTKGDYARPHDHRPNHFSFAYFVKAKWYYPPLIFTDSGKRIRPKEGRFVAFPSYLIHHVPKHRYKDERITLSGNFKINF